MNTTNITEEIRNKYNLTQNMVKLSGVETEAGMSPEGVPDADSAEGVALELSEEGKQKYAQSQKLSEIQQLQEWAKQMKEDNENAAKHTDDIAKIMTIFRRIANGDIVPWKDEKKLMEHSAEMYQAAKNIASMKENEEPKKYKSVDEDEEDDSGAISQEEAIRALSDSRSSGSIDISVSFEE